MTGPPSVAPNWFRDSFGLRLPVVFANVLNASSFSFRKKLPRRAVERLVPDFVSISTCSGLRPCSALKLLVSTLNSAMVSTLGIAIPFSSMPAFAFSPSKLKFRLVIPPADALYRRPRSGRCGRGIASLVRARPVARDCGRSAAVPGSVFLPRRRDRTTVGLNQAPPVASTPVLSLGLRPL